MNKQHTYKASRLHVAWIQFLTVIYTFWRSSRIIWIAYVGTNKKSRIDEQLHLWANNLLFPTGLKINVHNPHNQEFSKEKRIILMCNHSSLYDIPVSFVAIPGTIRMLTKKELFKIPVLGTALTKGGFVSIDRQNSEQARKDLKRAKAELEKGVMLWVAPEGTRSSDGKIHRFKKGGFHLAIETKAIIVPIGIRGINKVLPSNTINLTINDEIDVCIGKEIDAASFDKTQRNELLKLVEDEMRLIVESPTID